MPVSYIMYNFEFQGKANSIWSVPDGDNSMDLIDYKLWAMKELNTMSLEMSIKIETVIKYKLPQGCRVQALVEVKPGSLEWQGLISIIGSIREVILPGYLAKAIKFTVNAVLREHAYILGIIMKDSQTTVNIVENPIVQKAQSHLPLKVKNSVNQAILSQRKLIIRLTYGAIGNTIISIAILITLIAMLSKY